jgi:hypothetical protein
MTEPYYQIKGPGLIRALKEAASRKMNLAIAYDHDNRGNLLRVGYFFKERNTKDFKQQEINWFSQGEIEIIPVINHVRKFNKALLGVEFFQKKKNERYFMISLELEQDTHIILRNIFRIHKISVIGFVIQIEIDYISEGEKISKPVVRYDHAHGFIHRDIISSSGNKTKNRLEIQDTKGAILYAIEDVRKNLNFWLKSQGYKTLGINVLNQPQLNLEIEKVKNELLFLYDNPHKIKEMRSSLILFKEENDYEEKIWPPS